jgi:hypothetical protein
MMSNGMMGFKLEKEGYGNKFALINMREKCTLSSEE